MPIVKTTDGRFFTVEDENEVSVDEITNKLAEAQQREAYLQALLAPDAAPTAPEQPVQDPGVPTTPDVPVDPAQPADPSAAQVDPNAPFDVTDPNSNPITLQ